MTNFDEVINRLLRRIEKDADFFAPYHNVSASEMESLIREQVIGYLYDAIDKIYELGNPEIDFYDYDVELQQFNVDLTKREIGMLSNLMFLVFLERDEALLNAFKIRMSPSDLSTFSPAAERTSFENLIKSTRHECSIALSHYFSTDRISGEHKTIQHDLYDYES